MLLLCLKYFAKTNLYSAITETYSGQKDLLACAQTAVFRINSELAMVNNNNKKGGL